MSRERSFNIIRTAVSMLVAILVAFVIILLVSDQPVESIKQVGFKHNCHSQTRENKRN